MGLRYITVDRINDPVQIYARDDAKIYHSILGKGGIIPNAELGSMSVRISQKDTTGYSVEVASGVAALNGRIAIIEPNDVVEVRCNASSNDIYPRKDGLYLRFLSDSSGNESISLIIIKQNGTASNADTFNGGAMKICDMKIATIVVNSATDVEITQDENIILGSLDSIRTLAKQEINEAVEKVAQVSNKVNKVILDTNGNVETNNQTVKGSLEVGHAVNTQLLNVTGTTQLNGAVNTETTMDVKGRLTNFQDIVIRHQALNTAKEMFKIAKGTSEADESKRFTLGYDDTNKVVVKYDGQPFMTFGNGLSINQAMYILNSLTVNSLIVNSSTQLNGVVNASSTVNAKGSIKTEQSFVSDYASFNYDHEFFKASQNNDTNSLLTLSHKKGANAPTVLLSYKNSPMITLGDDVAFNRKIFAFNGLEVDGTFKAQNIQSGTSTVTSKVNEAVAQTVRFPVEFANVPNVTVSAVGTVPSELKGLTVSNISTTGFTYHLLKSSAFATTIQWIAISA